MPKKQFKTIFQFNLSSLVLTKINQPSAMDKKKQIEEVFKRKNKGECKFSFRNS